MDDRADRLESTVEQLRLAVASLERRLDVLEAKGHATVMAGAGILPGSPAAAPSDVPRAEVAARNPYDPIALLTLIGRLFLVLAGGFFLRAMTEAGALAPRAGLALASVYAMAWLVMADRAGRRTQVPGAVFHALAAAMIAFPLLVEATTRFKVLTGPASAVVLALLTAALLMVAWHRRLRAVAWVAVLGALPTSVVLLVQTGVIVPFAFYLVVLGVATLWLGYALEWWGIRWPAALVANLAVAGVTMRASASGHQDAPQVAVLLQSLLLGAYVLSIAVRTLIRGRQVSPFEVVQTAAALLVGFGGAVYLMRATGTAPMALGVAGVAFGVACYGVAAAFLGRREHGDPNLYFYTTLAFVLVITGLAFLPGGGWLGPLFAALAVLAVGSWSRTGRLYLLLHGVAYLVASAIVAGAFTYSAQTMALGQDGPWELPGPALLAVLVAGGLAAAFAAARQSPEDDAFTIASRFVIILCFLWTAAGCLIGYLAPLAGGLADRSVDPGVLATVRTGVLSLATLVIAWGGRRPRLREWGWLVYPLLVAIGLKMLTQDFKQSRPATLFIAMALYGAALIVAPRLRRGGAESSLRRQQ